MREDLSVSRIFWCQTFSKRFGSEIEHSIGDFLCSAERSSQAKTRENVHVVTLRNGIFFPVADVDGVERRTRCKHQVSVRPLVSLCRSAFGFDRGVRKRENNWFVYVGCHFSDKIFREESTKCCHTQENRGLELFDDIDQGKLVVFVSGKLLLFGVEFVHSILSKQSILIYNKKGVFRRFFTVSLFQHSLVEDLRDTNARTSSSCNGDSLVAQGSHVCSLGSKSSKQSSKCCCPSSLNIIVEAQVIFSVLVEQSLCHGTIKIFELNENIWPSVTNRIHKFIH
mmetsp:Transcript_26002/g.55689  ORF Transcript_26002/g.55689 Transcript_26002/m.55689 type:complete len:282 (+) Transcript_26002:1650-2495(+)